MADGKKYPILWKNYPDDSTSIGKKQLASRLRASINVSRADKNANIVSITFNSYSPEEAAALVNLTMDTYTQVTTHQNRRSARLAHQFLNKQQRKIKTGLNNAEENLKSYELKSGLMSATTQADGHLQQYSQLQQSKQQEKIKLSAINTLIDKYDNELSKVKTNFSANFANNIAPMLAELQQQLSGLEAKRIILLSKNPGLKKHPGQAPQLVLLNKKIGALKMNIQKRAKHILQAGDSSNTTFASAEQGTLQLTTLRQNLVKARIQKAQAKSQIAVINNFLAKQETQMKQVPQKTLQFARLQRQIMIKQNLYRMISMQNAQTALWQQTQSGAGSPLDYATVSHSPVKPQKALYLIGGVLLGLLAGAGYVLVRVGTNKDVDSPEKLVEIPYPLLAVIPDINKERAYLKENNKDETTAMAKYQGHKNWIALYASNSSSAEAFRKLQNNILYSRPDESLKTIMITSSQQGEGKSTSALNLASTLTEAQKRVLIVDADLRRTKIHKLAGLRKSPGLLDVIFEDQPLEACIQATDQRGVYLLSAGSKPPNPSEVLRSNKVARMIHKLREEFDYIIVDTPPLGVVGDAAPLLKLMDGVILVAKFKKTQIDSLQKLIEDMERLKAPILGTILTGFAPEKSAYTRYKPEYYFSYDSYYRYEQ
jgi:tyrosine-protein kinase Etk/Wzc